MKAFGAMLVATVNMLRRSAMLIITSLGLALISIFIFGWLFGSSGDVKLEFGVADQDNSQFSRQLVAGLKASDALDVHTGAADEEVQALRDGHRSVVLVIPSGFGALAAAPSQGQGQGQGQASLQVYYDQSSPVVAANARMAVQSIVAGLNQQASGKAPTVVLQEQSVSVHQLTTIDWMTPGMLGMLLMWANMGVGAVLVDWRRQGILRRLAVTPLRPATLISAQMLGRLVISLAQGAVLLAVAIIVFHVAVMGSWLALGLTVAVGALSLLAIGFIIGSFVSKPEVAQTITFLISFPMMFLSGSYFPTDSAPDFLAPIIKALPLTYLNDALRQIINNGVSLGAVQGDLLVLLAWMVVGLLLAARAFRWG